MKKFTIFFMIMMISALAIAQSKYSSTKVQTAPLKSLKEQVMPAQQMNPVTSSKAALEEVIGNTVYDMQTNSSVDTRIRVYNDGTIGAAWIRGTSDNNERGTGYNYYDGTDWGLPPTSRIENERTGWPSYSQLGQNGEIVIAHLDNGLKISTRTTKGTGPWSYTTILGPAGATDISWPRIMTNGPDHDYIHMMVWTYTAYQNLDLALLYYRSLDGGTTWDKKDVILPQLTSADYDGFNGDEVAWGTPHGDTIYFAVSGPWIDTFIMLSTDNGENWTKIPILSNANKKLPTGTTYVPPFRMSDGSVAVELDHKGIFHVAFGIGGGYMEGSTKYIYINSNGLVYWNSTMPMVPDSLDLDTLEAHGMLLGAVYNGPDPDDTITAAPSYRVGLSSMPQVSIDDYDNIYFTWSAVKPGDPSPDKYNYRHIYGRAWFHDKPEMGEMIDFNDGIMYLFYEFVYPAMAKQIKNDKLAILYQSADTPGSNIVNTAIPVHDNTIEFREIPGSDFWPVGIGPDKTAGQNQVLQNYPNPAGDYTRIPVSLAAGCDVTLTLTTVTGMKIRELQMGTMSPGNHVLTVRTNGLPSGIYFYTVSMGTEKVTRKMIIQ
ncbi:MAG: T9SS type A sorting domain-containing protein [Bacteroidales bacterium]|nr:T9SS type A sorting domain-containing protein [Bacteroidales bacterium]HNW74488.1 T9SS type A sorting domain-containing protein [Bacteroidales bacterium]HPS51363.1 T9SS type A sorting domain-containing protein [Bacteroidales bacterium]